MSRVVFFVLLASALMLFATALPGVSGSREGLTSDPKLDEEALEKLRKEYNGNLYLSYTRVHDLTVLLDDNAKFKALVKSPPPGEEILKALQAFLKQIAQQNMVLSQSIAVLHLDLMNGEASFVLLSDRTGVGSKVPWSKEQVAAIALFFDKFLKAQLKFDEKQDAIIAGKASIKAAWTIMADFKDDVFISEDKLGPVLRHFRTLIDANPRELNELKNSDPKKFERIEEFRKLFDKSIGEIKDDKIEIQLLPGHIKKAGQFDSDVDDRALNSYYRATGEGKAPRVGKKDLPPLSPLIDLPKQLPDR